MENTGIVVGAFVTIVTGFFAIAKIMLAQASKDRDADRQERKEMTEVFSRVAEASERLADEAKERNGHLGKLVERNIKATNQILSQLNKGTQVIAAEDRPIRIDAPGKK